MAILNYTTEVSTEKTVGEIQAKLVAAKASAVMTQYDNCVLTSLSFKIQTAHGEMSLKLPANIEGVYKAIQRSPKVPHRLKTREQAARVAWRIIKHWVDAQLAIIEAEVATLPQVFLPYMQNPEGSTMYEIFEKQGLPALEYHGDAA